MTGTGGICGVDRVYHKPVRDNLAVASGLSFRFLNRFPSIFKGLGHACVVPLGATDLIKNIPTFQLFTVLSHLRTACGFGLVSFPRPRSLVGVASIRV